MHTILLISATHLCHLQPTNLMYHRTSLLHLSKTLRLFRQALSQPITCHNADALIATAVLLTHHAWADIDPFVPDDKTSSTLSPLDLSLDRLFSLCEGLRKGFMSAAEFLISKRSIFTATAIHCPREAILPAAYESAKTPAEFEEFFVCSHSRITASMPSSNASLGADTAPYTDSLPLSGSILTWAECNTGHSEDTVTLIGYMDAVVRVAPVLSL